jgi:hypothetical protein
MTKMKNTATGHASSTASRRSRHVERSPGGPERGSRQVMYRTAPQSRNAPRKPGRMPAANSLPMLVSVNTP